LYFYVYLSITILEHVVIANLVSGQTLLLQAKGNLDFLTTGGFFKNFWLQLPRKSEILKRKT
jgi:hypothetical protein